ncbi:uncharacterized protein F4812DRAFT_269841 [Daldinia caldariorum]|uniref:uncharacterized protein n=1 Tax=Daldinia caldariorum TaxID=326644 RepID=UPI002007ECE9|nr:uncharacterized protein F4812DRAFT_269841 [Daldinia caldariorum]KAI1470550.1 hypothetical protein F4812DRAFT_269841 [Daldinia caldariorum]
MPNSSSRTSIESAAEDLVSPQARNENEEAVDQAKPLLFHEKDVGSRYAKAEVLSKYIPELNPSDPRAVTLRVKMAKKTTMLKIQLIISSLVVAVSTSIMAWSVMTYNPNHRGVGTYFSGNCSRASSLNTFIHAAMNILSSLLLSSGNYCMQLLVSPSRHEVEKAHSRGIALRIGIPNVTNLRHISLGRVVGWLSLGATAALLHLVWNSVIFMSLPLVSIPRALATADFQVASDNWTASDPLPQRWWWNIPPGDRWGTVKYDLEPVYTLKTNAASLTRLEPRECIKEYLNPLNSTRGVLVVARNITTEQNDGSSLLDGWMSGWDYWDAGNYWLCSAYDPGDYTKICSLEWADALDDDDWVIGKSAGFPNILVDYCLVGDRANNEQRCGLHYSLHIMVIVCICSSLQCFLVLWTNLYFRKYDSSGESGRRRRALVTVGDAIADFLNEPSTQPDGISEDIKRPRTTKGAFYELRLAQWNESQSYWFTAVGMKTWVIALILFAIGLAVPSGLIGEYINRLKSQGMDISFLDIWSLGFEVNPSMIGHSFWKSQGEGGADIIGNVLVANLPQVLVSFIYLFFNSILTRQLVADEWTRFTLPEGKKPLRVTSPVGMQRSTYFLSLPLKYSVVLMICSILLHWFISQGIFVVQTSSFGPGTNSERHSELDVSARGYSALGVLLAITLGAVLVLALMINSFARKYEGIPAGFQLIGMNSSGISLMCQRPDGDSDAHLFPVRIGVVPERENDEAEMQDIQEGRLVFSTAVDIEQPKAGSWYLQPALIKAEEQAKSGFPKR